jgi:DNA segregation ATPase FtsK/SpoIIIE-like protein
MQDLLPLRHLVTLDEISSFLRVVIPDKKLTGMAIAQTSYPTMTAEQIFDKYRDLITRDTYIVGLDDQGQPVTSSWDEVPHRLLAGVPGAGKTNFLRWLLFQFLYVNPKRKVYITDFKGLDFQFLEDLRTYADISITIESCQVQVATIQNEEFLMRQQIMLKHKVTKLSALRKELQKHNQEEVDRTLWLIDEAADISFASNKVRTEIENSLTKYARQGRSYGIQVIYCTQRVSSAVITPQVTDQCEEKVIFRVGSAASTIVLEDAIASEIPMNAKGRAVLDSPQGRIFINTPFMQSPEGSDIPISATLWKHLQP